MMMAPMMASSLGAPVLGMAQESAGGGTFEPILPGLIVLLPLLGVRSTQLAARPKRPRNGRAPSNAGGTN